MVFPSATDNRNALTMVAHSTENGVTRWFEVRCGNDLLGTIAVFEDSLACAV